jgi:hypothetical protein
LLHCVPISLLLARTSSLRASFFSMDASRFDIFDIYRRFCGNNNLFFYFLFSILNYCVPIFYFFFPFGSLNSASAFLSFIILFNFNTIAWIWWLICLTWSNHFYLFFLVLIYVIFLLVVILLGLIYVQLNACSFVLICIDREIDTGTRKKIINFCWSYKHSN